MGIRIRENLIYWSEKLIFSKDFWTVSLATICLGLIVTTMATVFASPEVTDKVFRKIMGISLLSFGVSWILIQGITSITFRYLDKKFNLPLWLIIIPSGCAIFTWFILRIIERISFIEGFIVILSIAFIPAFIFRLIVNFVDSYLQEKRGYSITT